MPHRSLAIALVVVLGAMAAGPTVAAPGDALVVRGDVVNMRTGPSTANTIEMRLFREQLVIERQRSGAWVQVEVAGSGGRRGWIHGSLLAEPGGRQLAEPIAPVAPAPPVVPAAGTPALAPREPAVRPAAAPAAVIAEAAMPAGGPVGGPIEPLTEPAPGGAAIELPNVAIATGPTHADRARAAPMPASTTTLAALPPAAPATVIQAIPPRSAAPRQDARAMPGPAAVLVPQPTTQVPASIEPAAAPVDAGLERFRESVTYLNTRAVAVAGVDLFTGVDAVGGGIVQVRTTGAWETIPPAGRESYLNALVDRWAASRPVSGPVQVQIVDSTGRVMVERGKP